MGMESIVTRIGKDYAFQTSLSRLRCAVSYGSRFFRHGHLSRRSDDRLRLCGLHVGRCTKSSHPGIYPRGDGWITYPGRCVF